jgi:hypothetical protein
VVIADFSFFYRVFNGVFGVPLEQSLPEDDVN